MLEKPDLLWSLYISERDFIRHHEEQRTAASNIMAAIAAGLLVALGTEQLSTEIEIGICIGLVTMGQFGKVFCKKLSELMALHQRRSYRYLEELESSCQIEIGKMKKEVKECHNKKHPKYSKKSLRELWYNFHLASFYFGIVALVWYILRGYVDISVFCQQFFPTP